MAECGMREEAYIPRMTGQLEFIHSVSHINLLNTFFPITKAGIVGHALSAPRGAILVLLAVAHNRAKVEHENAQIASAMRAYLVRRLDVIKGLCLASDKGTPLTLRQCSFVPSALAERMDATTCHVLAIGTRFLMKCIHGFSSDFACNLTATSLYDQKHSS
jgi:hypothetical protein